MIRRGDDPAAISEAVDRLRAGGLVAIPTETVYGLAADASSAEAVARVFEIKGRPRNHPLIVHIAGLHQLDTWASEVPDYATDLARHFWPGPLTFVLRRSAQVPLSVTGGQETVALRAPNHPVALAVLGAFGSGLAAPSANLFGAVSPTTAQHVWGDLGPKLDPARDLVLDGGPCAIGVESTIVDCTGSEPLVLRTGQLGLRDIRSVGLHANTGGSLEQAVSGGMATSPRAPGTLESHYSPQAKVLLRSDQELVTHFDHLNRQGQRVGLIAPAPVATPDSWVRVLGPVSVAQYAHDLYSALRLADEMQLDLVIAVPPESDGPGGPSGLVSAVIDRLTRAAA